jgi:hypothetical protein
LFAGAAGKMGKVGGGDEFFAVGAHIALVPEHGGPLSEVLPPLHHVGGGSSEATAMRWLLERSFCRPARCDVGVKPACAAFVDSDNPLLS